MTKRVKLYDIITRTRNPGQRDPLNQLMEEEARDLASEARRLRLEEIIEKRRRALQRTREGNPITGGNSNELYGIVRLMNEQLKTGVEIAKAPKDTSKTNESIEMMKLFMGIIQESIKGPVERALAQNRGGSFLENVLMDPNMYERAQSLNLFGSRSGKNENTNTSDVEIEKLRGERMLDSKRIDLELQRMRLEADNDRDKIGIFAQALGSAVAYGATKIENDMRKKGEEAANKFFNPNNPAPHTGNPGLLQKEGIINPTPPQEETTELRVNCDCGHDEMVTIPVPPPESLACPGCGKRLIIGKVDEEREAQLK